MISNTRYYFLLFLLATVYFAGIFLELFENGSARYAILAMEIVQKEDFFSLFSTVENFWNEAPLHYWLAALSFKVFGVSDWAYRLPGVFAVSLGAYSTFGLGKFLYNKNVGKLAALIFLTSQTILFSILDVKVNVLLTGFAIFSIWHFVAYINTKQLKNVILASIGAGLAFSTKGLIGILIISLPVICHLLYSKKWNNFLNIRLLAGFILFMLTITPVLYVFCNTYFRVGNTSDFMQILFYSFQNQFYKPITESNTNNNGINFLFIAYKFFAVFLPWSFIAFSAFYTRFRTLIKLKFKYNPKYEFLTLGGSILFLILILFTDLDLLYYICIIIPLCSILSASYLHSLNVFIKDNAIKFFLGIQYFLLGVVFIITALICFYVFKFIDITSYIIYLIAGIISIYFTLKRESYALRIITISVSASLLLNLIMNYHFYPNLLKFQAGSTISKIIKEEAVPADEVYKININPTWSLDFYNQNRVEYVAIEDIKIKNAAWVYATEEDLIKLRNAGFDWNVQKSVYDYNSSKSLYTFLNTVTRKKALTKKYLIHIFY